MKTKLNGVLLGSALLLVPAGVSWAEPSPDLMNSVMNTLSQAAKKSHQQFVSTSQKTEPAKHSVWAHTWNFTAGQSTVAIPDLSYHRAK